MLMTFIRGTERKNSSYKAIGIITENKKVNKEYLIRGVPVLGVLDDTKCHKYPLKKSFTTKISISF